MKISFNPSVSYIKAKDNVNTQKQVATNPNQYNEIPKNSMAELIGRSQTVSFGAINKTQGNIFEHICQEKFGLGEKDVIQYNKQTGCLKHEVYSSNGSLKRVEEYYPADRSEIIITFDESGAKTVQTTTPDFESVEKYDAKDREVYLRHEDTNGSSYSRETDYRRKRRVEREKKAPNAYERVVVTDLKTNKPVTTGPLVIDKRYEEQTNLYITENIVTKQVLKMEQRRTNGSLQRYVEFVEGSGLIKKEINYHPETGGYYERVYTGKGNNELVKVILTSKDGRKEQVIEYQADGINVKSNVIYTKNRSGEVTSATVYVGLTDQIDYKENYYDGHYTRTEYNNSPNVPRVEEEYDSKDNSIISRVVFYDDGKKKYQIEEYNEDDSFSRTTLNPRGRKVKFEQIEANGFLSVVEEFDEYTGFRLKRTQYDERSGYYSTTSYDSGTGTKLKSEKYNRKHQLEEETYFYEDGKRPLKRRTFNFDGSYKEINYNQDGTVKSEIEYDRYGQRKVNNNRRTWNWDDQQGYYQQQQRTGGSARTSGQTTNSRVHVESDSDFMDRISGIINKSTQRNGRVVSLFSKTDLSDSDWERLSKLINVSDVQIIKNMDKTTYRKLSKQFHPDLNLGKSQAEQEKAEKLFRIIQGIYAE